MPLPISINTCMNYAMQIISAQPRNQDIRPLLRDKRPSSPSFDINRCRNRCSPVGTGCSCSCPQKVAIAFHRRHFRTTCYLCDRVHVRRLQRECRWRMKRRARPTVDPEAVLEEKDWAGTDQEEKCTVCLEEFAQGGRVASMPCAHCFHKECIAEWLTQESNTCPVCGFIVK